MQPLYTMERRNQPLGILHRPRHACNATGGLDRIQPSLLLWFYTPAGTFYLDAGKYCYLLTHHLWGDGASCPADQVGAAFAKAKLHRAAIGVLERAGVIAKQAARANAARKPDMLLDGLFRRH